jgi:hypothetical protein
MDCSAKMIIPAMDPGAINQALTARCAQSRAELLGIFCQYKHVGVSIDGVTMESRKFLNIDIVNPISETLPFTYDFLQENSFDTTTFVDECCLLFARVQTEGLNISGVTSDGCAFQAKAFPWKDFQSVQAKLSSSRNYYLCLVSVTDHKTLWLLCLRKINIIVC